MKKMIGLFVFLMVTDVFAVSDYYQLQKVGVEISSNTMFLVLDKEVPATNGCITKRTELRLVLDSSDVTKMVYSTALSAHAQGRVVRIGIPDSPCVLGRATLDFIYVE